MRTSLFLLLLLCAALPAQQAAPATVTVAVLSLFHPQMLALKTASPARVLLDSKAIILAADTPLTLRRTADDIAVQAADGTVARVREVSLAATALTLTVPGKLSRAYTGGLSITVSEGELRAVVALPVEAAVASIVAAEAPADAAPEALKAQAILARSYLLAEPHRHRDFTACDTTHCQYLRAAPLPGSRAALATAATASMVLTWQGRVIAAMYSRSCGGTTRALEAAPPGTYPFFAVRCMYCQRHPERWTRDVPQAGAASERGRIAYNREHGWAAVPSTSFSRAGLRIEGRGVGHGVGLCQVGAQSLALRGQTFLAILNHYFPAASVTRLR